MTLMDRFSVGKDLRKAVWWIRRYYTNRWWGGRRWISECSGWIENQKWVFEDGFVVDDKVLSPSHSTEEDEETTEDTDGEDTDGEETDGEEIDGEETDGEETDGEETDEEGCEENFDSELKCEEYEYEGHD